MNAVCIPGIGRGSCPCPNMRGANVALQGGICKVVVGGRIDRGNEIGSGEGVGRDVRGVACVGVVCSRLIGSAKNVLGRKRPYGAQNPTLGRLGPRIR